MYAICLLVTRESGGVMALGFRMATIRTGRSGSRPRRDTVLRAAMLLSIIVMLTSGGLATATATPASAAPCADVDVVFARGTLAPSGLSPAGELFVDAVTANLPGMSVSSYAVDYPASLRWKSLFLGATDVTEHVTEVAAQCPDTTFVLAGASQGAAVVGIATGVPDPIGLRNAETIPGSLAPRVAAVVVFAYPSILGFRSIDTASPLYGPKTREFCNAGDPVCLNGFDITAHLAYDTNGSIAEGGRIAADKVKAAT